jgi:hypothetical protein
VVLAAEVLLGAPEVAAVVLVLLLGLLVLLVVVLVLLVCGFLPLSLQLWRARGDVQ